MGDYAMADLANVLKTGQTYASKVAKNSTSAKAGKGLEMDDFLMLMVATLQNQSIDETADTSDMLNQMVQMSVITAINNISSLVSESTSLTYAASLVGKEVTIGIYDGNSLKEIVGTVTGTGTLNGRQVIFIGDDIYYLTDIMAVGRLPASDEEKAAQGSGDDDGDDSGDDTVGDADSTETPGTDTDVTDPKEDGNVEPSEDENNSTDPAGGEAVEPGQNGGDGVNEDRVSDEAAAAAVESDE